MQGKGPERRLRSGTVEHVGTNLERNPPKDLPLVTDMFIRLRGEVYENNPDGFLIALYSFFSYYEKIIDHNNFSSFPLLSRMLALAAPLLDAQNQAEMESKGSFASAEEMRRVIKMYKTVLKKHITLGANRDALLSFELAFEALLTCEENSDEQQHIQLAILAFLRNDTSTFTLQCKVCLPEHQAVLTHLGKMADALPAVKSLIAEDVHLPKSTVIAGFELYSQHQAPGAHIPLYNRTLDEPDFPIVCKFLTELGRLDPHLMLAFVDMIIETFLIKNQKDEYVAKKLDDSTFVGCILNLFGPLLSNVAQRSAFKGYQDKFRLDPDKILAGDSVTRAQYLRAIQNDIRARLKHANHVLQHRAMLSALVSTDICNAGDPAQHKRRQQIHAALLAYFMLLREREEMNNPVASDVIQRVLACEHEEDRVCFKTLMPHLKTKIDEAEKDPALVASAREAFETAHPVSRSSTPLLGRRRGESGSAPARSLGDSMKAVLSRVSRGRRDSEDGAVEKETLSRNSDAPSPLMPRGKQKFK